MKRRGAALAIVAAAAVMLAGLAVSFVWSARAFGASAPKITLPNGSLSENQDMPQGGIEGSAVLAPQTRVELTPENVGRVVATLSRPEEYSAETETTLYYSGGQSVSRALCYVKNGFVKTELLGKSGMTEKHVITGGGSTYIWRAGSRNYYSGPSGEITADDEQRIPTYEVVTALDPASITDAKYVDYGENGCIFVSYTGSEIGYTEKYWISTENGLLVAAETADADGEQVYSMKMLSLGYSVSDEVFRLPDGRYAIQ